MRRCFACCLICVVLLFATVAAAADKPDYTKFLEQYGASDVLQREVSGKDMAPDAVVPRAEALLQNGDPQSALKLLESSPPAQDPKLEARKTWLMGRAMRMLGKLPEAVFRFSQALAAEPQAMRALAEAEPGLDVVWRDVWRQWFWKYWSAPDLPDHQALAANLDRAALQGASLWPNDEFFKVAPGAMRTSKGSDTSGPRSGEALPITDTDRATIARALALVAIGQFGTAGANLTALPDRTLQAFWTGLLDLVQNNRSYLDPGLFSSKGHLKAVSLFQGYWQATAVGRKGFVIQDPESPSWPAVKDQLLTRPPREAVTLALRDVDSPLLAPGMAEALRQMALAFALLDNDPATARRIWGAMDRQALPVSLKVAGLCLVDANPRGLGSRTDKGGDYALVLALAGACGLAPYPGLVEPFWRPLEERQLTDLAVRKPLDHQLLYMALAAAWKAQPNPSLARRLSFLYPASTQGVQALMFLADEAGKRGAYNLATYYLSSVDPTQIQGESLAAYLLSKGKLDVEMGNEREAYETYRKLYDVDRTRLDSRRKLHLALLAQRQGDLEWAQNVLLDLNTQKDLPRETQAEVLFWLAEGHQALGHEDQALDNYMKVAHGYADQGIWAPTAMYRAALLYEMKGKLDTAARLFQAVAKSAPQKEQQEAAKDRLGAIEGKLKSGKDSAKDKGSPYPY